MENYTTISGELINSMLFDIMPILAKSEFNSEVNYINCRVWFVKNDFGTVWVKWGNHDCQFKDLPIMAMAAIVDNILSK